MRFLTSLAVLAASIGLCGRGWADPAKLTAAEISAGWIMLFDGHSTFGWKVEGKAAAVKDGALGLSGDAAAHTNTAFGDFELNLESDVAGPSCNPVLVLADPSAKNASVAVALRPYVPSERGVKKFWYKVEAGKSQLKVSAPDGSMTEYAPQPWKGPKVVTVGFTTLDKKGEYTIGNIKLRPLGGRSIFNGKDLAGWKVIPGHKSKFSVTSEGWINVKDGNGDLHSEGEYDDFVLQMDIISNGAHLNSGIFYRSVPNEFWSGYESQIRNEWVTDVKLKDGSVVSGSVTKVGDTVKVLPATQIKESGNYRTARQAKTFKSDEVAEMIDHRDRPVDIGTGGIYNHQAARKVVSTDHEWFTKTLVVHSNHMAVWINGYQVSDFTDEGKMADSARKGRKDSKGPLSIQGHDPTTDLSFRNIRIAELSKP